MDDSSRLTTPSAAGGESSDVDVLVIGGGIVGAGIARDAAMRGLRTALVEQADFASGTSSRSTRLLHGGIRYLAQGRIALVREANREKGVIRHIAPHLAEPLPFIFPARKGSTYSRWKLALGVKLYDLLCGRRKLGRSRTLSHNETLAAAPGIAPEGLTGAVRYFDALTNDARLVIDTLRSAARHGADVRNYVSFRSAEPRGDRWRSSLVDVAAGEPRTIDAACLVNATGPWSDRIPGAETSLRLTKGVHLVVQRSRMPIGDAVVTVEKDRILFAIPWGERVILGTTDTDYSGPLAAPVCNADDLHYVLDAFNEEFPGANLGDADVLSTWAGLRPLVADHRGDPSDISRRHEISMSHSGWWDVTGGKLTTYRLIAEETVHQIEKHLGRSLPSPRTASEPLLAAESAGDACGILPPPVSRELVQHFCRHEWARRLTDVMIRRTSWRYYHQDHLQIAQRVCPWMASELRWSDQQQAEELSGYQSAHSLAYSHAPDDPLSDPAREGPIIQEERIAT